MWHHLSWLHVWGICERSQQPDQVWTLSEVGHTHTHARTHICGCVHQSSLLNGSTDSNCLSGCLWCSRSLTVTWFWWWLRLTATVLASMVPSYWRLKRSNISLSHWAYPGVCPVTSAFTDTENQGCCIFLSNIEHNATVKCNRMKSQKVRRRPGSCHSYHPKVRSCHTYTCNMHYGVIVMLALVVPILIMYRMVAELQRSCPSDEPVSRSSHLWCISKCLVAAWSLWYVSILYVVLYEVQHLKRKILFVNINLKINVAQSNKMAYNPKVRCSFPGNRWDCSKSMQLNN